MMTEVAKVVSQEPGFLWLETIQKSTCNSCVAQKGCGYGLMNEPAHQNRNHFKVALTQAGSHRYQLRDSVQIEFPEQWLVKSALLVYGLPLIAMLLSALLASWLAYSEAAQVASALLGLIGGFLIVAGWSRWRAISINQQVRIKPLHTDAPQCVQVVES